MLDRPPRPCHAGRMVALRKCLAMTQITLEALAYRRYPETGRCRDWADQRTRAKRAPPGVSIWIFDEIAVATP